MPRTPAYLIDTCEDEREEGRW